MKDVKRISNIPAYIFSKIDEVKNSMISKGEKIIDLGIGDPDKPTPRFIVDALSRYAKENENQKYAPYSGIKELKVEIADYYKRIYNVDLDWETEVAVLIGSKEGIAHLFLALGDEGDTIIVPDPGYPVYSIAAQIAGLNSYRIPLQENNMYLPEMDSIPEEIAKKSRAIILNYPNNPTGAVANIEFFKNLLQFGKENDLLIVNDGAYSEILETRISPLSILQVEGAKDNAVEFGSLSKSYNMSGWRLGYIVGNRSVIKNLVTIKTYYDSGQFPAVQRAGVEALKNGKDFIDSINTLYSKRRKKALSILKGKGFQAFDSKGAFYLWFKVPKGYTSESFTTLVLEKAGVIITPGNAFGKFGEGYCRISLTIETRDLETALNKIKNLQL